MSPDAAAAAAEAPPSLRPRGRDRYPEAVAAELRDLDRAVVAAQGETLRQAARRGAYQQAVRPRPSVEGGRRELVGEPSADRTTLATEPATRRLIAGGVFDRPLPTTEQSEPESEPATTVTTASAPASPAAAARYRPDRTQIMGILNVTVDSFSDGGRYVRFEDALDHARLLVADGADIIDVGGESTRPGAARVDPVDERRRILPVIRELAALGYRVSVDTMNAATAAAAVDAGAEIVNDVSGGLADPEMARVVIETGTTYIATHWRGHSAEMSERAHYADTVAEVKAELFQRVAELVVQGVDPARIVIDPGLGFAKNGEHNWQVLGNLGELAELGLPLLVAASRKRFLGDVLPESADLRPRDTATAVISAFAAREGAWAVRVHDVASTRAALAVEQAWQKGLRG